MIGIDTNVLLRLLVRDHEEQVRVVEHFITTRFSKDDPGYVSRVVIAETAWVLKDVYGYDRKQIAAAIRAVMNVSELLMESADEIDAAIADFEQSSAGFTDCLLARTNVAAGCDHTVTFDRKAAKLTGFKLLTVGQ
jgi:predicted nucleic-acid-binding protein